MGDKRTFKHDGSPPPVRPSAYKGVCIYYQERGICLKGDQCEFQRVPQDPPKAEPTTIATGMTAEVIYSRTALGMMAIPTNHPWKHVLAGPGANEVVRPYNSDVSQDNLCQWVWLVT